jgi:radical SAM protein with 4Fe4S-binding SPASM domain
MTNKCKSPWTSIFIETNGKVKSCCAGAYYWGDLHDNTIEEIINDPKVQQIRQELIADAPSDYCSRCRLDETRTGYSLRNYYDQFTASQEVLSDATAFVPRNLDIRWNSLCNLNCVYCNEYSSTRWQKLKNIPVELTERAYYDSLLEYIAHHSQDIEIILLVGGEPLLPRQNTKLLKSVSKDIHLDIISNLSVDLETNAVFQQLKENTQVKWKISCETIGQRFEYVRHGAKWDKFVDNLKTIKALPGHQINLLPVYCIYSAVNLVELYEFVNAMDIQIHWQNLWGPDCQNVANFSPHVRKLAIEEIDRVLALPYIDKFDHSMNRTFLKTMRSELLAINPNTNCNQQFLNWSTKYEADYAQDVPEFALLWSDLDKAIKYDL